MITHRTARIGLLTLVACTPDPTPKLADTGAAPYENPEEDAGPEGHEFTSFSGSAEWKWSWSQELGDYGCDLLWATESTETTTCEGCDWAFTVHFTYDDAKSHDDAACFAALGEEAGTDFDWDLGLNPDYLGYGFPFLMYADKSTGYWTGTFFADWQYPSLDWEAGALDRPYATNGETYYYSANWHGTATVQ